MVFGNRNKNDWRKDFAEIEAQILRILL